MKRKIKPLCALTTAAAVAMLCSACAQKPAEPETDPEVHIGLEQANGPEYMETMDEEMNIETMLVGTYKECLTQDEDANEKEHLFTDELGNDFVALESDITQIPNGLTEGNTYAVYHDGISTRSLPPIFNYVTEIVPIASEEVIDDAVAEIEDNDMLSEEEAESEAELQKEMTAKEAEAESMAAEMEKLEAEKDKAAAEAETETEAEAESAAETEAVKDVKDAEKKAE